MAKKDIVNKKKDEVIYEAKIDNDFKKENNIKIVLAVVLLVVIVFSILFL